jgi:hypothetical protein
MLNAPRPLHDRNPEHGAACNRHSSNRGRSKSKSEIKIETGRDFANRNVVRPDFFNAGRDLTAFFFMPILSF